MNDNLYSLPWARDLEEQPSVTGGPSSAPVGTLEHPPKPRLRAKEAARMSLSLMAVSGGASWRFILAGLKQRSKRCVCQTACFLTVQARCGPRIGRIKITSQPTQTAHRSRSVHATRTF